LKLVGCANVERQVAVENGHYIIRWDVLGEKFRVSRLRTTVATYEDVETLLSSNETKVLVLCLGAFTYATRYSTLDLVRPTDGLVALF
jgi:hypothetical protein